ncbi:unnamed protein product, partial [Polarella glacialis]
MPPAVETTPADGRRVTEAGFDVKLGSANDLPEVIECLAQKAFCVIDASQCGHLVGRASQEAIQVPGTQFLPAPGSKGAHVADGLLGAEGSCCVFDVQQLSATSELRHLDAFAAELCLGLASRCRRIVGEASFLSEGLLLETRTTSTDAPSSEELTEASCSQWLDLFARHRLMLLFFLGPGAGLLELGVFGQASGSRIQVRTRPNVLVVLRPDIVSRTHSAAVPGTERCFAYSRFLFASGSLQAEVEEKQIPPYHADLLAWCLTRLKQLKELEVEAPGLVPEEVPRAWLRAMSSEFTVGQQACIRGSACRLPGPTGWHLEELLPSLVAGADFIIEVPLQRFDVDAMFYSDPRDELWRESKTYSRHGSFVDGAELFDHRFFGIAASAAPTMPVSERWGLEVGYEAIFRAGWSKASIRRAKADVLVGVHTTENQFNMRTPDAAQFGPGGSQARE